MIYIRRTTENPDSQLLWVVPHGTLRTMEWWWWIHLTRLSIVIGHGLHMALSSIPGGKTLHLQGSMRLIAPMELICTMYTQATYSEHALRQHACCSAVKQLNSRLAIPTVKRSPFSFGGGCPWIMLWGLLASVLAEARWPFRRMVDSLII